jgi:hypothetical protein
VNRIIIVIEGGVVQRVLADRKCDVRLMDYDELKDAYTGWDEFRNGRFPATVGKKKVDQSLKIWDEDVTEKQHSFDPASDLE